MNRPGPGCEFRVTVVRNSPIEYSIGLSKVGTFALHGTVKASRVNILRRKRMRKLLALDTAQ